ncbi:MAG: hypothetical protein R2941_13995 [Desulfobacterales bacterium]
MVPDRYEIMKGQTKYALLQRIITGFDPSPVSYITDVAQPFQNQADVYFNRHSGVSLTSIFREFLISAYAGMKYVTSVISESISEYF